LAQKEISLLLAKIRWQNSPHRLCQHRQAMLDREETPSALALGTGTLFFVGRSLRTRRNSFKNEEEDSRGISACMCLVKLGNSCSSMILVLPAVSFAGLLN